MSKRCWWMAVAIVAGLGSIVKASAQEQISPEQRQNVVKKLLDVIKRPPFYALDWHTLKLVAPDQESVRLLKDALNRSRRSKIDIKVQSLWIDAAAGHPEAALSFHDANVIDHPDDKTLPNAACWARAAHGFDLKNAVSICNAALAVDRKSHTLIFRGMVQLQVGNFNEALRDFDEAIGDSKLLARWIAIDAVFGRGIARVRLGDENGRRDIKAAIQADDRVVTRFGDIGISE